jgi:hypothetical protein
VNRKDSCDDDANAAGRKRHHHSDLTCGIGCQLGATAAQTGEAMLSSAQLFMLILPAFLLWGICEA